MKKQFLLLVLVLFVAVCLVSCAGKRNVTREQLEYALDTAMQSMLQTEDYFVADMKLHAGGYLVVLDITDDFTSALGISKEENHQKSFFYRVFTIQEDRFDFDGDDVFYDDPDMVPIFYDEDGAFCRLVSYKGYKGTDTLVYVTPNMAYGRTFETTPERDFIPYDNLGTKPLFIQDEAYQGNCPVWIFDLAQDAIDESYELHYGSFVLTGKDILSGSWNPPA